MYFMSFFCLKLRFRLFYLDLAAIHHMLQLLTDKALIISLLLILNLAAFFLFKHNPRFIRGPIFYISFFNS